MKIKIFATGNNGAGFVTFLGEYEDWEDIDIRCGMFAPDVVITFKVEVEKDEEEE